MIVDFILESYMAGGVGTGLTLQHNRTAIRHNQSCPDQQHA